MSSIVVAGDTSGSITISAPLVAGSNTLTLPVATDTLVGKATTDTLTNKSIAATQLTGTVAASVLPAGTVLQVKNSQTGAVATGTTLIPYDNTIPQITEGTQFLSLAITPTSATSKLYINIVLNTANSAVTSGVSIALFQDSTVNALAASNAVVVAAGNTNTMSCNYFMISGTTSSTTFTVRAGSNTGTFTLNGTAGVGLMGGVASSSITITEVSA